MLTKREGPVSLDMTSSIIFLQRFFLRTSRFLTFVVVYDVFHPNTLSTPGETFIGVSTKLLVGVLDGVRGR